MADEYISRDAAIASLCCDCSASGDCRPGERCADYQRLKEIPAADVAPVRHGKWLEHRTWAKCSECEYLIGFETTYCPNCGARKDGNGE